MTNDNDDKTIGEYNRRVWEHDNRKSSDNGGHCGKVAMVGPNVVSGCEQWTRATGLGYLTRFISLIYFASHLNFAQLLSQQLAMSQLSASSAFTFATEQGFMSASDQVRETIKTKPSFVSGTKNEIEEWGNRYANAVVSRKLVRTNEH